MARPKKIWISKRRLYATFLLAICVFAISNIYTWVAVSSNVHTVSVTATSESLVTEFTPTYLGNAPTNNCEQYHVLYVEAVPVLSFNSNIVQHPLFVTNNYTAFSAFVEEEQLAQTFVVLLYLPSEATGQAMFIVVFYAALVEQAAYFIC